MAVTEGRDQHPHLEIAVEGIVTGRCRDGNESVSIAPICATPEDDKKSENYFDLDLV